jgi:hypothetical protein
MEQSGLSMESELAVVDATEVIKAQVEKADLEGKGLWGKNEALYHEQYRQGFRL